MQIFQNYSPVRQKPPWLIFVMKIEKKYSDQIVTKLSPIRSYRWAVLSGNRATHNQSNSRPNQIVRVGFENKIIVELFKRECLPFAIRVCIVLVENVAILGGF